MYIRHPLENSNTFENYDEKLHTALHRAYDIFKICPLLSRPFAERKPIGVAGKIHTERKECEEEERAEEERVILKLENKV